MMKKLVLTFFIMFSGFLAHGKMFSNSYVNFQLPANWSCKLSGTEWVCRSADNSQAKQAIIVLTAKEIGPNDNFAYYNNYLKSPKTPKHRDGTVSTSSKVQHLKTVQIGNHQWIDALHMGSLLPNFYSRYLVTIKGRVAVLITFSARKDVYTRYSKAFFEAINSLVVVAPSTGVSKPSDIPTHADTPIDIGGGGWEDDTTADGGAGGSGGGGIFGSGKSKNFLVYGMALILIGIAAFFLLKRKG